MFAAMANNLVDAARALVELFAVGAGGSGRVRDPSPDTSRRLRTVEGHC